MNSPIRVKGLTCWWQRRWNRGIRRWRWKINSRNERLRNLCNVNVGMRRWKDRRRQDVKNRRWKNRERWDMDSRH